MFLYPLLQYLVHDGPPPPLSPQLLRALGLQQSRGQRFGNILTPKPIKVYRKLVGDRKLVDFKPKDV